MKLEALQAELNKVERRRIQLEQQIKARATALYTSLPGKVGLKSVDALVLALAPYASPAIQQKLQVPATMPMKIVPAKAAPAKGASAKAAPAKATRATKNRKRRYSDEKKAAIRRGLQEGKLTTKQISTKHGLPINTVKKWKRQWRLTSGSRSQKNLSKAA